jgi:hypothetical protein
MPSLLRHTACPACTRRHHFCLPDGDARVGQPYDFVCPETGKRATLTPAAAAEAVAHYPQGAVHLVPARRAQAA